MERLLLTQLLRENFRLEGDLTPLEGYDNANFLLSSFESKYVVKLFQNNLLWLEDYTLILDVLGRGAFWGRVQYPIKTKEGRNVFSRGNFNIVVLSWLEGSFVKDNSVSPNLAFSLGVFLGELHEPLQEIALPEICNHKSGWNLTEFQVPYSFVSFIKNKESKLMADHFFSLATLKLSEKLSLLRKAVIHGDANDWNVLASGGEVTGLIDFGDCCYSWLINEIAIAAAYLCVEAKDPIGITSELVRGFNTLVKLKENELEVLHLLIGLRASVSIAYASKLTASRDDEYVSIMIKPFHEFLCRWIEVKPETAQIRFMEACGLYDPSNYKADNSH